jgi:hypothetical protein
MITCLQAEEFEVVVGEQSPLPFLPMIAQRGCVQQEEYPQGCIGTL